MKHILAANYATQETGATRSAIFSEIVAAFVAGFDAGFAEKNRRLELAVEALEKIADAAWRGDETTTEMECLYIARDALADIKALP